MNLEKKYLLPSISPEAVPFWEGTAQEKLLMQRCLKCEYLNWFPRARCRRCGGTDLRWDLMSGNGLIYSFSIIYQESSFPFPVPYVLALVDLVEGPRMMTHIRTDDPACVQVGSSVSVCFERISGDIALPMFTLVPSTASD